MRVVKILVSILVALLLVVGGIKLIKKRKLQEASISKATIYPIVVTSYTPKEKNLLLTLPYLAIVKNSNEVIVNSKFAGRIEFIKELGDEVKKGEVVAKIDNSNLKAKLKNINENIKSLKAKLNAQEVALNNLLLTHSRTKKLLEVKMASIEEYELEESKIAQLKALIKSIKNSIKSAKAAKEAVIKDLSYTILKSPIDGMVSAKFLNLNDNAYPAKPILKITPKNGNYLFIPLAEEKKEIIYKGKIYPLTPLNTTYNGLKVYKANVEDSNLAVGERVNIEVVEFRGVATALPYDAILNINNKHYVFLIDKDRAICKEVHILGEGKNIVAIKEKINKPIVVAKPDILLKIKAGYPIKVKG